MKIFYRLRPFLFAILSAAILTACNNSSGSNEISISTDFESGSIGEVQRLTVNSFELRLRDDNYNSNLPDSWRNWWYVRLDSVPVDHVLKLIVSNRGWSNYYLPVYSYDRKTWHRLSSEEVKLSESCNNSIKDCKLIIEASFEKKTVYLARYYPYPFGRLQDFLGTIENSPFVTITNLGNSPKYNFPTELVEISNPEKSTNPEYIIWLHARTHPAETGGSFFIEGVINKLLLDFSQNPQLAERFAFYVVPMHNPDGVL